MISNSKSQQGGFGGGEGGVQDEQTGKKDLSSPLISLIQKHQLYKNISPAPAQCGVFFLNNRWGYKTKNTVVMRDLSKYKSLQDDAVPSLVVVL